MHHSRQKFFLFLNIFGFLVNNKWCDSSLEMHCCTGPKRVLLTGRKFGYIAQKVPSKKLIGRTNPRPNLNRIFTDFKTEMVENNCPSLKNESKMLILQRGQIFHSVAEFFGRIILKRVGNTDGGSLCVTSFLLLRVPLGCAGQAGALTTWLRHTPVFSAYLF